MDILGSIRQLRFPPELRIRARGAYSEVLRALPRITSIPGGESAAAAGGAPAGGRAAPSFDLSLLAKIGTSLWRIRRRMPVNRDEASVDVRNTFRHLDAIGDSLHEAGVEIIDHTNAPYVSGMELEVLAFQATDGVVQERILETIRPSVYLDRCKLQMGQVIVGTPPAGMALPLEEDRS